MNGTDISKVTNSIDAKAGITSGNESKVGNKPESSTKDPKAGDIDHATAAAIRKVAVVV